MKNTTIHVDFRLKKVIKSETVDTEVVVNKTVTQVHSCAKVAPDMRAYWCGDCKDGNFDKCFYRGFTNNIL